MPKGSLKDKVDGDELDLSLSELTTIPVKEIAALSKVRSVDLSCNLLTSIPREFCTLNHLTKIDLSKNRLQELPDNIGSLQKLQHLDLYANKLTTLPIGIGYLKNLKWLDLKDNELEEPLKSIAGDCLDETQCRACATKIVKFMKSAQSEQERQKQKELQAARDEEARKKSAIEAEKQRLRQLKKQEKERRRKEYEAKREMERQETQQEPDTDDSSEEDAAGDVGATTQVQPSNGIGCFGVFLAMISGLLAVLLGLYYYCLTNQQDQFCRDMTQLVQVKSTLFVKISQEYILHLQNATLTLYDSMIHQIQELKKSGKETQ